MASHLDQTVTSTVLVPFEGVGGGVAELSWGQAEMWRAIAAQQSWMPLGGPAELPPTRGWRTRSARSGRAACA